MAEAGATGVSGRTQRAARRRMEQQASMPMTSQLASLDERQEEDRLQLVERLEEAKAHYARAEERHARAEERHARAEAFRADAKACHADAKARRARAEEQLGDAQNMWEASDRPDSGGLCESVATCRKALDRACEQEDRALALFASAQADVTSALALLTSAQEEATSAQAELSRAAEEVRKLKRQAGTSGFAGARLNARLLSLVNAVYMFCAQRWWTLLLPVWRA
jgi:chromosome segregation ATPase